MIAQTMTVQQVDHNRSVQRAEEIGLRYGLFIPVFEFDPTRAGHFEQKEWRYAFPTDEERLYTRDNLRNGRVLSDQRPTSPSEEMLNALELALEQMPYMGHLARAVVFHRNFDDGFRFNPVTRTLSFSDRVVGGHYYRTDEEFRPYAYKAYNEELRLFGPKLARYKPSEKPLMPLMTLDVPFIFTLDDYVMTVHHEGGHGIAHRVSEDPSELNHPIYRTYAEVAGWQPGMNPHDWSWWQANKAIELFLNGQEQWRNPMYDWERVHTKVRHMLDRFGAGAIGPTTLLPDVKDGVEGTLRDFRISEVFPEAFALYLTQPEVLTSDVQRYFGRLHDGLKSDAKNFLIDVRENPEILLR